MTRRYQTKIVLAIGMMAAIVEAAPKATLPLPLFFEPNRGQAPAQVRFLARGNGMSLLLEDRAAVLQLPSSELRMRFTGNPQAIEALDPLPGVSSYFVGNDSTAWRTGIPQSGRVRYRQVYPGIDLIFRAGTNGHFEYDFVVAPNADPSRIAVRFEGAQSIESDGDGGIVLHTSAGEVRQARPYIYQDFDSGRREIRGSMIMGKRNTIRFNLGEYDHTRELTIDPLIIQWLVGNVDDDFGSIARDSAGNVYIAGSTSSTSFTSNLTGPAAAGQTHVFITKLSPDLTMGQYFVVIGGSQEDLAAGMTVDSAGSVYLTGTTHSTDFPTTVHAAQSSFGNKAGDEVSSSQDAFILKLDSKGATLVYSTFLGGNLEDSGVAIAVDSNGVAYVTGNTDSSNFPITQGGLHLGLIFVLSNDGTQNIVYQAAWVAKLSADGGTFDYIAVVGANDSTSAVEGIAIDSSGNAYIAGTSYGLDFPTAGRQVQPHSLQSCTGCYSGFVAEVNSQGNALVFSTYWGGSGLTNVNGLALDSQGNIYIAGQTNATDLPVTAGTILPAPTGSLHGAGYVAALNNSGSAVLSCTHLSSDNSNATGVIVRAPGVIGIAGGSTSTSFGTVQAQPGLAAIGAAYVELDPLFQHLIRGFSPNPYAVQYTAAAAAPDGSVAVGASTYLLPATSGQLAVANRDGVVILVTPPVANTQSPAISSGGVVSASSFGGFTSISPGSWIEIYGSSLAADTRSWASSDFSGINGPTSLDGTTVTIGGKSAYIDYISPTQVNALVSSDTPLGQQQMTVMTAHGVSSSYPVTVAAAEPGLLAPPAFKIGGVQYTVAIFSDGAYALPTGAIAGVNSRPAKPGDVLVLYGVGFGSVTPSSPAGQMVQQVNSLALPFQMAVGGVQATLFYDGLAPGYLGLYQFNLTVPSVAPNGAASLTFKLNGGTGTQIVAIAVGN